MTDHTAKEITDLLKSKGYVKDHSTGDHRIYKNKSGKMISVPFARPKDSISIGTYKSIIRLLNSNK